MPTAPGPGAKGHICPPSDATHPSDRWESLFVYSFICKFTHLRGKVEGLETPMDFENALLSQEPNTILTKLLSQFILNLRPQTRNLSMDQISTTVAAVLSEYFKSSERTIYWNEDLKMNVDPFEGLQGGFFTTDWDFKLKILRQLVELQLCHTPEIKNTIDRAWGVTQNKHKKKDVASAPPDPTDVNSQERLQLVPIGQDIHRKRFWVADDSPRLYVSTNPWKTTATFKTISSTREEYMSTIEELKRSAPAPLKRGEKRTKLEASHLTLVTSLESRLENIDAELTRVAKVRKKLEQRQLLLAQAEVRETRTRRQTQKPDYDDVDEDTYQEEEGYEDDFEDDEFLNFRSDVPNATGRHRDSASNGRRRSSRTAVLNANGKREKRAASSDSWGQWRGERRSSRLEESTTSSGSADNSSGNISAVSHHENGALKIKVSGAAALKPTEIALEQIAGKKRSKFWVYAVEPVAGGASEVLTAPTSECPEIDDWNIIDTDSYTSPTSITKTDIKRTLMDA
ncbi:hypothetical protein BD779DRAFT_1607614 [Infundibulicybe gibba]|nr:hypothetical protein BD779DRAFT_1607614 [Infundibulicybe gibba]